MLRTIAAVVVLASSALAYNPPVDSAGPITATIQVPDDGFTQTGAPYPVKVSIANSGATAVDGTVEVRAIDRWTVTPAKFVRFHAAANGTTAAEFKVRMAPVTYAAQYPIHAYVRFGPSRKRLIVHPIAIVVAKVKNPPGGVTRPEALTAAASDFRFPESRERVLGNIRQNGATYSVSVTPGTRGLLDGAVRFSNRGHAVSFSGFEISVYGHVLDPLSPYRLTGVRESSAAGTYALTHHFEGPAGAFDVVGELWLEHEVLRARWHIANAPAPKPWSIAYLEDVAVGPWNARARRIYAGQGNVIVNPEAFRLNADGHKLATSYAAFEFPEFSVLQAINVPANRLDVDPMRQTYSIHNSQDVTMTFIPSSDPWQAAMAWHDVNGLHAAPGVPKLAGRFVFDLWHGDYAGTAEQLQRSFAYGLTDAVVIWHNWQRWGYDYRLPDIYPPNPTFGTLQDFVALAQACRRAGVLFAPHDNYIDDYPDSDGFTYSQVAFRPDGSPWRAWYNKGREAQSYRWRADKLTPSVQRNLKLLKGAVPADSYFIDVWASERPFDHWTSDGRLITSLETRKVWGDTFNWIRTTLGGNAPQISEAGNDTLVGSLDGATSVHLRVAAPPETNMVWSLRAEDSERIPWLDAAHHDRFVLHGAGYEDRYAAGQDLKLHGIGSDDYISTEVMTGHPAMVSVPFSRDAVRQYWLLHDPMRALAMRRMTGLRFDGGDIHRQRIQWDEGVVFVNRGASDWTVDGHVLPTYGYLLHVDTPQGVVESAIERREGEVVEWSRSPSTVFVNARGPAEQVTSGKGVAPVITPRAGAGRPVQFPGVMTAGAFRITRDGDGVRLLALPESAAFDADVDLRGLPWRMGEVHTIEAVDAAGNVVRTLPVVRAGSSVRVHFDPAVFAIRVR